MVIEEGAAERQVKVLIKYLAIFFLFPSKTFLPISFKIQLLETSPQKQKEQRQNQLDVSFYIAKFVFLLQRLQRLKLEWQKSPAGTWANIRQKQGLVWRNLKKISQITFTYRSSS